MSGRNFWFPCVVSSVFLAAVAAENAFGQRLQYVASDLGSFLAGGTSSAAGINNLGHVVGVADSSGYGNAFLYSGGSLQDLGTLGGEASSATSINNAGQVVGEALTSSGAAQAFLYSGGTMQNLGTLLGAAASCATGINNLEQVAVCDGPQAFLYSSGSMQSLGTLSTPYNIMSVANGINDKGQVAGAAYNSASGYGSQAFLFGSGSLQGLGTLPTQPASVATAVNNLGQVVGYGDTDGYAPHAFLYSGGSMQNLGAGEATAINNLGQVVGEELTASGAYHAFLYSGGTMQDLNSLIPANFGLTLVEATGINDSGQICGYGINASGQSQAFILSRTGSLQVPWGVNGGGSWSTPSNWAVSNVPGGVAVPGLTTTAMLALGVAGGTAQDSALFGTVLTSGTATVTLDASRTLSGLSFSPSAGASYVISPSGASTLTLASTAGTAGTATISDTGSNTINAPIALGSNLGVGVASGGSLTVAGGISGSFSLSVSGGGALILSGSNTYTGTTTISGGNLQIGSGGTVGSVAGNIVDDGALVFDRSDNPTFAGVISGSGSLVQAGSGLLVLDAANTYTGGTTISAGSLQIGSGGTVGSVAGNIVDKGALVFDCLDNSTFAGVISGSGSLTQAGPGMLVLSGSNTFTGTTMISAGTLVLANSNALENSTAAVNAANSLAFASTGTFNLGGLSGSGSLALSNTAGSAIALVIGGNNANTTYAGAIGGPGSLAKNGTGSFTLAAANTYAGTTTINAGTLVLANADALQYSTAVVAPVANGLTFAPGIGTFNLGGLSGSGGIALNDTTSIPITLQLAGSASTTYSGTLSGPGGLTQIGPGTLVLTASNSYSGATTISAGTLQVGNGGATGSLPANSSIADNGTLVFNRGNTVTQGADFSAAGISGTGSLVQAGAGLLVLNAANTYSGGTTISAGTLQVDNGGATGSIAGNVLDNASLAFGRSDTLTFGGAISGSGSLTQLGPGKLVLTASNGYTGGTTISAGTLQIDNGGSTGSLSTSSSIADNGTLVFNRGNTVTQGTDFSTAGISGTGSLVQAGVGLLALNAANTYTGGTTISAGTLQVGNGGAIGSIAGNVLDNALLAFSRSDTMTFGDTISGSGNLTQIGPGTLVLTASNSYSGATTISAGTLQVGNGGATGSLPASSSIADNGTLVFNRGNTVTQGADFSAAGISGTGSLVQAGAGLLVLNAANTYSGGTTISAGTLQVDNGGATGSIAGNVLDNASLAFGRSDTLTFGGAISGSGSLTQLGPGKLVLTASNDYTGGTTISAGTLQIDNGGSTGSIAGNIVNNAVLVFDRADNYTFPGNIAGAGSLIMNGPGTLLLTGTVSSTNITVNQGQISAGPGSLSVTGSLTVTAGQRFMYTGSNLYINNLSNSGTFIGGAQISGNFVNSSSGSVRIGPGQTFWLQSSTGTNSNAGTIEVFGNGASQAQFESAAPFINAGTIAAQNATLYFDGGLTNQATVAFTGGASNVFGNVTNNPSGTIVLSGGAAVTFYNNVVQNGTFDVSTVGGTSSAVFLGAVSGSGTITGNGEVLFMGDPVLSGDHTISAAMMLGENLTVSPPAGGAMTLSGDISGTGSLIDSGDGQLILSGSNSYTGGTAVDAGTLYVTNPAALPTGTALTVGAGGTMVFDPAAAAAPMAASCDAVNAVPEPSTLALLGAGVLTLLGYARRVRRSVTG